MNGNTPNMFDYRADPVVYLLILTGSVLSKVYKPSELKLDSAAAFSETFSAIKQTALDKKIFSASKLRC